MIDVLVAGGGPVGLATAVACAQAGLSVTVAEPRDGPVDKACGEGVMPAAVGRLAALGVRPDGYPLRGIRYLSPGHRAEARFRRGPGLGVRRTVLQAALSARAASLGVAVLPVRVTALEQHPGHVTAGGLEARYLVAADGLHSTIRRLLAGDGRDGRDGRDRWHGRAARRPAAPRYGLRRHYHLAPWTDLVEVHWSAEAEAYVTPVAAGVVGVAVLGPGARRDGGADGFAPAGGGPGPGPGRFESWLSAAFPRLGARLGGAPAASDLRGAGPLRQDVRRRVHGRVLLAGDASGYVDALTGEGLGVGLAQAAAIAGCLAAGRPGDYERAWRRVSGPAWRTTAGLLWWRGQPWLAPAIVPAAQHVPWAFAAVVNHVAQA